MFRNKILKQKQSLKDADIQKNSILYVLIDDKDWETRATPLERRPEVTPNPKDNN